MNDIVTLEQWSRLFELGKKFKNMKPWEKLCDFNLFAVEIEGMDIAYFIILGGNGDNYGFLMYLGEEGLNSIKGVIYGNNVKFNSNLVHVESEYISMLLRNREDVSVEQYNVIRELGLRFRGKNNWICFEKKSSGCLPDDLKKDDADNLEIYLDKFLDAFEYYVNNSDKECSTENSGIYFYRCHDGIWSGNFEKVSLNDFSFKKVFFEDEVSVRRVKKQKKNNHIWEVDCFLLESCLDEDTNKICIPKCIIIVEQESKMLIRQDMYKYDDSPEEGTKLFLDAIMELGRPKKVIFSDIYIEALLEDICNKCGIKYEIGDVHISKEIEEMILDYMKNKNIDILGYDDIDSEEGRAIMLMKALLKIGIDVEKVKAAAENMSYENFQKYFIKEIENILENLSEDDFDSISILQEVLSYYSDYEMFGDWYDLDDEYDYVIYNLKLAKDKILAINNFFRNGDMTEEQYEMYEQNGMWIEINVSDKKWSRMLKAMKKSELLNYAEKVGAFIEKSMNKDMLINAIMSRAMLDKHNLRNALSKDENALMKFLFKKAKSKYNEIDTDQFEYTSEDLISLFNHGLIDIGLSGNPYSLILEVYPLGELEDMWKGK